MNDPIKTIKYKGYTINVYYDDDPMAPDEWCADERFIVYEHRNFTRRVEGFDIRDIYECWSKNKSTYKGYFIFPLNAYIHSGVTLSFKGQGMQCRFDTSFAGFALIKRTKGSYTYKHAKVMAKYLIESWNGYLNNEVYGYISEIDSCWGYYGEEEMKEMIAEAKAIIDAEVKYKIKQHIQKIKRLIKNKVALIYRPSFNLIQ